MPTRRCPPADSAAAITGRWPRPIPVADQDVTSWKTYTFWTIPDEPLRTIELPAELLGYQTYTQAGLPPGPICTPTIQSIDAALVPDTKSGYLFFLAKIQEVSRKLNVKVEFVKSEKEILEKTGENPEEKPSLIVVDLNSNSIKPLSIISKMRSKFKKPTSIVGFVSHVQGDLKMKAQEAGCDVVMPRSAFSQNLPNILRRHGADDEIDQSNFNRA